MKSRLDWTIYALLLVLSLTSLLIVFSVAPERLTQQALYLLIGFLLFVYLSSQDSAIYKSSGPVLYIVSVFLLAITLLFGINVRGSSRWLSFFGTQFQISELVKPFLIVSFADFITRWKPNNFPAIAQNVFAMLLPVTLIFFEPDLGTSIIYTVIWSSMMLIGGLSTVALIVSLVVLALGITYSPFILQDYQLARITSFLDPTRDPLGSGYNVIQSMIAIGSGKFLGKGLGKGTQSHLRFLPEKHTDFIFASLGEEFGFIGAIAIILIFFFLLYTLLRSASKLTDMRDKLIIIGVFTYIFFQAFLNIAMNLGIAPVTGVTLPLVSVGGSSILGTYMSLGIAISVMGNIKKRPLIEIK